MFDYWYDHDMGGTHISWYTPDGSRRAALVFTDSQLLEVQRKAKADPYYRDKEKVK